LSIEEKIEILRKKSEQAKQGGGLERIEKQHKSGKLTARERLVLLLDPGSFEELGRLSLLSLLPSVWKKISSTGRGYHRVRLIDGRRVYVFAQDFTVMGGSLGEHHANKICAVMERAVEVGSPSLG